MKEILFRGHDGLGWVYGSAVSYDEETETHYMLENGEVDEWLMVGNVGQYIGIIDKDECKVFLGDLVRTSYGSNQGDVLEIEDLEDVYQLYYYINEMGATIQVIGTIYDL